MGFTDSAKMFRNLACLHFAPTVLVIHEALSQAPCQFLSHVSNEMVLCFTAWIIVWSLRFMTLFLARTPDCLLRLFWTY